MRMPLHKVEMTMNSQGRSCPAANSNSVDPGDGGGAAEDFLGMFGDRRCSGDLFDVVRQGGAGGGGSSSTDVQPCSHFPSSSPPAVAPLRPAWEDKTAAWLYPIVRGDELVFTSGNGTAASPREATRTAVGWPRKGLFVK